MEQQNTSNTTNALRQLAIAQAALTIDAILDELAESYPGAEEEIIAAFRQM